MRHWRRGLSWLTQAGIGVLFGFPLYWVVVTALNSPQNVYKIPPAFIPQLDFKPLTSVLQQANWTGYILNTVMISVVTVILVLITSALGGYALASLKFRGKNLILLFILGTMMIPAQAILIPQFVVISKLHLLNTYAVEIVPFAASAFGVFMFRQFFMTMPKAYWEAVTIEGGNHLFYLWRVAVPLAKPAVITTALLTFIGAWNMFQWPLIMTNNRNIQPLEVVLAHYMTFYQGNIPKMTAAVLIALLPIAVVFFIAQRHIVAGVAGRDAGIKG
ncbi:carbohydrate ABC transporter permease [Alicyclobacillus mengziensis]|uniref:Carbohydrate ABC transporter permease n=1 Tax=Alicyclobacillus mengziensis TaxID=2931921 RepID=A0A9X7VVW4_9BACL|nr:carbohydrate ABC transporter permease [Alicyclobacillus mengziensis]QSO46044.1 carbohydrate ABC transporter permease [Alicyclobacillus mengziensis]